MSQAQSHQKLHELSELERQQSFGAAPPGFAGWADAAHHRQIFDRADAPGRQSSTAAADWLTPDSQERDGRLTH